MHKQIISKPTNHVFLKSIPDLIMTIVPFQVEHLDICLPVRTMPHAEHLEASNLGKRCMENDRIDTGCFIWGKLKRKDCSRQNRVSVQLPIDGTSLNFTPEVDNFSRDLAISAVAAATVKLIPVSLSMRYNDLGITAIGHLEHAEFVGKLEWSEHQIRNNQVSFSTSTSSPGL